MTTASTYHYFEACGFVSEPFQAADLDNAAMHVMATFRNPTNPNFDGDDGGLVAFNPKHDEWQCVDIFYGAGPELADNERLQSAIDAITGDNVPTPGGP